MIEKKLHGEFFKFVGRPYEVEVVRHKTGRVTIRCVFEDDLGEEYYAALSRDRAEETITRWVRHYAGASRRT